MEKIMSLALFVYMICLKTWKLLTTRPGLPYNLYLTQMLFRCFLKSSSEGDNMSLKGKLFHNWGATVENARSPTDLYDLL